VNEKQKQRTILKLQLEREREIKRNLAAKRAIAEYKDKHKSEFFVPFPHQQKAIDFIEEGKKTVVLQGANQVGKTATTVNLMNTFMNGCVRAWGEKKPLYPSEFSKVNAGKKIIGRILCNNWETAAKDTIVPKLKEFLRDGTYEMKKNTVGVEHEFIFPKTSSKFTILTYKEDTKSHEGWTGDVVICDEPPPRDKYIANRRGLIARNGVMIIAMTAISEDWILDEIVLKPDRSVGVVGDIPIEANTTLTPEAIRVFEQSLTEDEKVARIKGGWLQLTGRIWKVFSTDTHVVRPFKIPPDWPCSFQIDFHLDIPHAISFCAVDPLNRFFIFDEVWLNIGNKEIADEIARRKIGQVLRMKYGEIDALSKGDTSYTRNRFGTTEASFEQIGKELRKYSITLGVGSKAEKDYIKAVETRLKGPNGMPTLFIFDTCTETIKQVQRWSYDNNHQPKADGHFPEAIGRFTQQGLKYTAPDLQTKQLQYAEMVI